MTLQAKCVSCLSYHLINTLIRYMFRAHLQIAYCWELVNAPRVPRQLIVMGTRALQSSITWHRAQDLLMKLMAETAGTPGHHRLLPMGDLVNAAGLAFTFVIKAGIGISGLAGDGFVIRRVRQSVLFSCCTRAQFLKPFETQLKWVVHSFILRYSASSSADFHPKISKLCHLLHQDMSS